MAVEFKTFTYTKALQFFRENEIAKKYEKLFQDVRHEAFAYMETAMVDAEKLNRLNTLFEDVETVVGGLQHISFITRLRYNDGTRWENDSVEVYAGTLNGCWFEDKLFCVQGSLFKLLGRLPESLTTDRVMELSDLIEKLCDVFAEEGEVFRQ